MSLMTTTLMITTALIIACKDLTLLVFCLLAHLTTGKLTEQARDRARATRLWSLLQATGTERKVMLFEYLLYGTVGQTFGPDTVMYHLFGGQEYYRRQLGAYLAERYDEKSGALFSMEATLDPQGRLEYLTGYLPLNSNQVATEFFYAAWPDATQALMSYYGSGEAEIAAVGLEADPRIDPEKPDDGYAA